MDHLHLWESRDFLIASCLIQPCKFFWTDIRRLAFVTLFTCITIITSKIDPVRFQKVKLPLVPSFHHPLLQPLEHVECFQHSVGQRADQKPMKDSPCGLARGTLGSTWFNLMMFTVIQGSAFPQIISRIKSGRLVRDKSLISLTAFCIIQD